MFLFLFFLSCSESKPQSDEDCVTFYDKCNSGCDLVCGSIYQKQDVESQQSCDLGCIESEDSASPECILVGEECQFED